MFRPHLVSAEPVASSARVVFRFTGALRDASGLTRLLLNLDWPDRTRIAVSLSETESLEHCVVRPTRYTRPRPLNVFAPSTTRRGELSVVAPQREQTDQIRRCLDECATALRQFGFDDVEIISTS